MDTASNGGTNHAARWSLRSFGGFELTALPGGDRAALPGKRDRVLLAYLLLSPNHRQPRRKLTTLLWGDASDETSLDNLRVCVWSLRKALGDTKHCIVASEGDDIVLDVGAFEADVLAFRRFADQPGRAELEAAAKLYAGEFLDGLSIDSEEFESWRRIEAARYRDQAIETLNRLMTHVIESGENELAIETGLRILRLEPLHEATVRRLMRLYRETGRRSAAVQLYRTLAAALQTDLNAEPDAETSQVFAEMVRHKKGRKSPVGTPDAVSPPPPNVALSNNAATTLSVPVWMGRVPRAISAGGLVLAIGFVLFLVLLTTRTQQSATVHSLASSAPQTAPISIAVLPFANLSGDATQEFFSDGMTEEITAAVVRIPAFRVVARASAFQFKGGNKDMRAVGQALGARYLIDGSVRSAGNRVRITAQLIQADSGITIWSEMYERELTDVFTIEEDIARAITMSLRAPLGLMADQNLVSSRGIDAASYQQFLRAKALVRARDNKALADAAALLEPITVRNSGFAPALGQLALIYQRMPANLPTATTAEARRRASDEWLSKAERASERAIELDPSVADGYSSLGLTMAMRGRLLRAEDLFSKALALDPFYPEALHSYSNLLSAVGRHKEALATREQLIGIEPFVPVYGSNMFHLLWVNGRTEDSIAELKSRPDFRDNNLAFLAKIYAGEGKYAAAAETLRMIPSGTYPKGMLENALRLMSTAPGAATATQALPRLNIDLDFAYVQVGAFDRILRPLEDGLDAGYLPPLRVAFVWEPLFGPLRKTERFKAFARDYGLVDYWRTKGWPSVCRPEGADDFVCD